MSERINHYHVCSKHHVFGHDLPPKDCTEEEYDRRHDCPVCGENVRDVIGYPNDEERERREREHQLKVLKLLMETIPVPPKVRRV